MAYVINGKVVEKKPFNIFALFLRLWRLTVLFFQSIFSSRTVDSHTDSFNSRGSSGGGSGGRPGSHIHRVPKPTLGGGCSGGGCSGGSCGQ